MSIITIQSPITKGSEILVSLSKANLLLLSQVSADAYYSDSSNWRQVTIHYKSTIGNQREVLILDATQAVPSANFMVSLKSRNAFAVEKIVIRDFDNGFIEIPRTALSAAEFDIDFTVTEIGALLLQDGFTSSTQSEFSLDGAATVSVGQRIMLEQPSAVTSVKFKIGKTGSPTRGLKLEIYDTTMYGVSWGGSLGNSSYKIATSNVVPSESITSNPGEVEFTFSAPVPVVKYGGFFPEGSNNYSRNHYYYQVVADGDGVLDISNKYNFTSRNSANVEIGGFNTQAARNGGSDYAYDLETQIRGSQSPLPAFETYVRDFSSPAEYFPFSGDSGDFVFSGGNLVHDSSGASFYQFNPNNRPQTYIPFHPGKSYKLRLYVTEASGSLNDVSFRFGPNALQYITIFSVAQLAASVGSFIELPARDYSLLTIDASPMLYIQAYGGKVSFSKFEIIEEG